MLSAIEGLDPSSPIGAFLLVLLGTMTPFPAEVSAIAVAMWHGVVVSAVIIWTAAMCGAVISYCAAILLGRTRWITGLKVVVRAREGLQGLRVNGQFGWLTVLGLRLIPLVPFFALSLAAGLLRVPFRDYLMGTALGIVPLTMLLAVAGQGLLSENTWVFTLTLFGLAGGICVLLVWKFHFCNRDELRPGRKANISPGAKTKGKTGR